MTTLKRLIKYSIIILLYFGIVISLSLPLFKNHSHVLGGQAIDLPANAWYQWFTAKCVFKLDFGSLYHADLIAYPSGKNLLFDLGFQLLGLFSTPFQAMLDFPANYNLFIITLVVLNGFSCFMLAHYLYKDTITSFLCGLFFSINPYVFYHINRAHTEVLAIFWIPLFFLFLFKIENEKKKKYAVIAALVLVLASLSYWYYGTFLTICTIVFFLYSIFSKKEGGAYFTKKITLLLLLYSIFMITAFFYPFVIQGIRPSGYEIVKPFPLFQNIIQHKTPAYFDYMVGHTSLHYIPPLFFIIAVIITLASLLNTKSLKVNLFCIIVGGIFLVLSFGPYLSTSQGAIPLPYILFYYAVPFFPRLWYPINCFAITLVSLSILLGSSIYWLRSKACSKTKFLFSIAAIIIYLFPYYNGKYNIINSLPFLKIYPVNYSPLAKPHEVYYYLKEQPDCAIIELPLKPMYYLLNQTIHKKKLFNCPGYAVKETVWPKKHLQFLYSNPFLRYLDILFSNPSPDTFLSQDVPRREDLKIGLKQLYDIGVKFIVVSPGYFKDYASKDWLIEELKNVLKKPYKEYTDGVLLYRIEDLIYE